MVFGTELNLLPPDILSRAMDLIPRIEGETMVTAFVARVRCRYKYFSVLFSRGISELLHDMTRDHVAQVRERRTPEATFEQAEWAARLYDVVFSGENTGSPWTESPIAAHYGTDIRALMKEMSPELIEGFWEERHHTLRERILQLNRFGEWLQELEGRIKPLSKTVMFLYRNMRPPRADLSGSMRADQLQLFSEKCKLLDTQYRVFTDFWRLKDGFLAETSQVARLVFDYSREFPGLM